MKNIAFVVFAMFQEAYMGCFLIFVNNVTKIDSKTGGSKLTTELDLKY